MDLMHEVLCDTELHAKAARVYKKVWQSSDLHGKEDNLVVREAAAFWNEQHCETAVAASQPAFALVADGFFVWVGASACRFRFLWLGDGAFLLSARGAFPMS